MFRCVMRHLTDALTKMQCSSDFWFSLQNCGAVSVGNNRKKINECDKDLSEYLDYLELYKMRKCAYTHTHTHRHFLKPLTHTDCIFLG